MLEDFTEPLDYVWAIVIYLAFALGAASAFRTSFNTPIGRAILHGLWVGPVLFVSIAACASGIINALIVIFLWVVSAVSLGRADARKP